MKFIKSFASPVDPSGYELNDIYKNIELAGRTCYKSEMSNDPEAFVKRMINSGHTAMLEHGTMYFDIPLGLPNFDPEYMQRSAIIQFFKKNPYSKVNRYVEQVEDGIKISMDHYAITTNYRVFEEQIDWDHFSLISLQVSKDYVLKFLCEPTQHHERRYTFKFVCDRGVSHELVRHRVFSFAQESTRYCNYANDKFGSELTFIVPSWMDIEDDSIETRIFRETLQSIEERYLSLISEHGWRPQQARSILPNAIKTEVVMTGYESDWKYFVDLRYDGTTGAPHPDMKRVAFFIKEYFKAYSS